MLHERHRFRLISWALVLALAFSSCWRDSNIPGDPKSRLSEYVSHSFEVKGAGDKKVLLDYLTGDAKTRLEAWSDDQFLEAFTTSKRQFLKLAFREVKPIGADRVNITYEVTYLDQQSRPAGKSSDDQLSSGHNAKVTTKKLCELTLFEGKWFINEVHNIKELVEYQDDLTITPTPSPKAKPSPKH
jgi:hypothetical protein